MSALSINPSVQTATPVEPIDGLRITEVNRVEVDPNTKISFRNLAFRLREELWWAKLEATSLPVDPVAKQRYDRAMEHLAAAYALAQLLKDSI